MGVRTSRAWLGAGVVLVGATSLLLIALAALTQVPPGWFDPPRSDDPQARRAGESVEGALVTQLTAVRPSDAARPPEAAWASEPWGVAVEEDQANAWLATLLPRWLSNQEWGSAAESVEVAQVRFGRSWVDLALRVRAGDATRVLSARIRPFVDRQGGLWTPAERLAIGRLPIPVGWAAGQARRAADRYLSPASAADPQARRLVARLLAAMDGREPITRRPVLPLKDGRMVRLLSLTPRDGRLEAVFRTEASGDQ